MGWHRPDMELHLVNDHVCVPPAPVYPWGSYAYLLRWEALPTLLDCAGEVRMPVDHQWHAVLPCLRTYLFYPPLVIDRSQLSGEWPTSLG